MLSFLKSLFCAADDPFQLLIAVAIKLEFSDCLG